MTATRSVAFLAVVAVLGLTLAPAASGSLVGGIDDGEQANEQGDSDDTETEHGQNVATFMQTSAADTENTVESEMFEARYEAADDEAQERLIDDRADGMTDRLKSLETERQQLRDRKDELSPAEYRARMSRLTVEIAALERSVERVKPFARDTNVGIDRLETVQKNVAELAGQQVAEFAAGSAGFNPYLERGPFDDHVPGNGASVNGSDGTPDQPGPSDGERGSESVPDPSPGPDKERTDENDGGPADDRDESPASEQRQSSIGEATA